MNTSATYSSLNDLSEWEGVKGRETINKSKIVVAVEVAGGTRKKTGRVRFRHVHDFSAKSLVSFVTENVTKGSKVITDGWEGILLSPTWGSLMK